MARITQERIDKLRQSTAQATMADINMDGVELRDSAVVQEYLQHYAARPCGADGKPLSRTPCIGCGTEHSFTWGLVHGAGHCTQCGWPARLYHSIENAAGEEVCGVRGILLWAHPNDIEIRKRKDD